jgi:hypothetical protein
MPAVFGWRPPVEPLREDHTNSTVYQQRAGRRPNGSATPNWKLPPAHTIQFAVL